MTEPQSDIIPEGEWIHITNILPIACVDVLPVVRNGTGQIVFIGLISRIGPDGSSPVWCQIGGRLRYGEFLLDGAKRQLEEVLVSPNEFTIAHNSFTLMEYFPDYREGSGHDPRKHAIAQCYFAEAASTANVYVLTDTEAREFRWFNANEVANIGKIWPGTDLMIARALENGPWQNPEIIYSSLADRERSRDEMMWQAPALALAAMAFLLTIAFGNDGPGWAPPVAALLCGVIALMCLQLMARHGKLSQHDGDILWAMELANGWRDIHRPRPGGRIPGPWNAFVNFLAKFSSRRVWMLGLVLFFFVSLASFFILI